jgi:predicted Zn finger-like uncharacterized protein
MRFVCESCRAQYMINDDKVGPKGVKVRCRKCGYVITVKRTDGGGAKSSASSNAPSGPANMSNDPDDATATQVMQSPLAADATLEQDGADVTNPGNVSDAPPSVVPSPALTMELDSNEKADKPSKKRDPGESFLGADEDEIGAVFDQVLKTGPNSMGAVSAAAAAGAPNPFDDDDRQSTRVIDADTVAALAKESGNGEAKQQAEKASEAVPEGNWFVAINEKQTGPLSLDKVKEHWDRGEIGPDSLCWREGYGDWLPLSEVKALASVLAPKPPKPIVVPTAVIPAGASVVSVPVQSAFSAGGLMQTVQSEMQVPMSAAPPSSINDREESGAWKPSAASALASLVKDEMDALSKPAVKAPPPPAPIEEVSTRGLLDLPEKPVTAPLPAAPAARPEILRAPTNPYLANPGATYSSPAVTQYRPQSNRGLIIGAVSAVVLLLLLLIVLVVWSINRAPAVVVQPTPTPAPVQNPVVAVAPTNPPAPTNPAVANPAPANPAVAANPNPAPANPVAANPNPAPANPNPANPAVAANPNPTVRQPVVAQREPRPAVAASREPRAAKEPVAAPEPVKKEEKKAGGGDAFDEAFGAPSGGSSKKEESKAEPKKKADVYVPPAPGSATADLKPTLEQGDILEVVLANKTALAKCATDQRAKDPGTSGKLVMKWSIQTSGKVGAVNVVSEEFKGTYMASCVGGLIKSWTFPRHKTAGEPVTFPFKF